MVVYGYDPVRLHSAESRLYKRMAVGVRAPTLPTRSDGSMKPGVLLRSQLIYAMSLLPTLVSVWELIALTFPVSWICCGKVSRVRET